MIILPYATHLWYQLEKTYNPQEIQKQVQRHTFFSAHFSFSTHWVNPATTQNELEKLNHKQSLRNQRPGGL